MICKLRTTLGKFGKFWAHIAYIWLAWRGRNHFVYTQFTKLSKEIADPSDMSPCKAVGETETVEARDA